MVPHGIKMSHYFSVLDTIWNLGLFDSPLPCLDRVKSFPAFLFEIFARIVYRGRGKRMGKNKVIKVLWDTLHFIYIILPKYHICIYLSVLIFPKFISKKNLIPTGRIILPVSSTIQLRAITLGYLGLLNFSFLKTVLG